MFTLFVVVIIDSLQHSSEIGVKYICDSCNTGTSVDILGNARVPVLQLICYTSSTLKICPNHLATVLTLYIGAHSHYDCGICI